ncbi:MAG: DUF2283 domain-containing protein [Candidatus Kapabacteria bacterium]|jgi:uncharacterized protein YuzE|nr:DUF2283 domain-containing protein [Candidatus Kapabacteria bacterium]
MESSTITNTINEFYGMLPHLLKMQTKKFWLDYDKDADVLYINYKKPQQASDSEMLKDGVLLRYRDDELVGITLLDASKRID